MKQSAVEWLSEQIKEYDFSPRDNTYLIEIPSWILKEKIDQAKQMEKEQIIELLKWRETRFTKDAPLEYVLSEFEKL
jgi:hypothetical protein